MIVPIGGKTASNGESPNKGGNPGNHFRGSGKAKVWCFEGGWRPQRGVTQQSRGADVGGGVQECALPKSASKGTLPRSLQTSGGAQKCALLKSADFSREGVKCASPKSADFGRDAKSTLSQILQTSGRGKNSRSGLVAWLGLAQWARNTVATDFVRRKHAVATKLVRPKTRLQPSSGASVRYRGVPC